jgi:hypothetical protein
LWRIEPLNRKKNLKIAINSWHIEKNQEVIVKDSNKWKLRVIYKDQNCSWYLYATPTGCGDAWAIKKIPYKHICRATIARLDHIQLTAKVIAYIIYEDVKKIYLSSN